jgi:hypothetical protein
VDGAEVAGAPGEERDGHQQHENDRPQRLRSDRTHRMRAEERAARGGQSRRNDDAPVHFEAARIAPHGRDRPHRRGELIGAEENRDRDAGEEEQQGGHLDQPAPADDRIGETREEGESAQRGDGGAAQQHRVGPSA